MIDAELGKPHHVNNGREALLQLLEQSFGRFLLMLPCKRKNHAPVAALEIAVPGPAAFVFQQNSVIVAEAVKIRIAWDDYPFGFGQFAFGVESDDAPDQPAVVVFADLCPGRLKFSELKKQPS